MINEDTLEEIAADGAEVFALNQTADEFISLMQEKWYNTNRYILSIVFRSIRAHNDLIKES